MEVENIQELVKMNLSGDTLSDIDYMAVADYWKNFSELAKACPEVLGKGAFNFIINKSCETQTALMNRKRKYIVYRYCVQISGNLSSDYCFETDNDVDKWLSEEYPILVLKYANIKYRKHELDALTFGDYCHVSGEGDAVYRILDTYCLSPHRPVFQLSNGFNEEVAKCYKVKY